MYCLYLEYCKDNNITNISTESIYRQIFNTEFNLSFFIPKKDLCDTCHNFENLPVEKKSEMEEEYQQHLRNKELSRQIKNNDKESARSNPLQVSVVFDLQQVLSVPKSNVGVSYYKLKLSTYNFTMYNLLSKECQCFMWNECIARRGSSEIGSCLLKFVEWHVQKGFKEFSFFSDNCSGQNRNKFLFAMYSYLSQKYVIKIRHTFLEPGHTQNEGDCVHSVIERAARNIPIYTPEQWCSVVRTAKRKAPFYTVYELTQKDVFDLRKLQNEVAINFDKDIENRKVLVSKFKILEFDPKFPNFLFFKTNYEDEQFVRLNLIERGRRSLGEFDINSIELKPLFTSKIPIPKKKYDHLQFLCVKGAITPHYHDYFKQLPFTSKSVKEEDEDD
nr:unnamed protein product [Callosobruchus analis]